MHRGKALDKNDLQRIRRIVRRSKSQTLCGLAEEVSRIAGERGLTGETYLGLAIEDWINLGVSLLIVLAGYLIGTWLIRHALRRLVKRTTTKLDDRLLEAAGPEVRWLVVILVLQFATVRLTFVSASLKIVLSDIYFVAGWASPYVLCGT